ncbi:splicing regulator SDE2-like [Rhynchophorus ferrugineus]|uniref:splicing regulator SDE2-like n=1 Tax=Rhynchophorus ferrugineus TaxID=354439 RepID=UPI003FCE8A8A
MYLFQGLDKREFYLLSNGKRWGNFEDVVSGKVEVVLRILGGKGGFGSMLRSMGHQFSKNTNKDSCRNLDGRRLRDVNEEKRLRSLCEQHMNQEKESKDKKQKKLEKMCQIPKFEFNDKEYETERSVLREKIEDAVTKGLEASRKRKSEENADNLVKKKKKLWGDELDAFDSSEELSDEEEEEIQL